MMASVPTELLLELRKMLSWKKAGTDCPPANWFGWIGPNEFLTTCSDCLSRFPWGDLCSWLSMSYSNHALRFLCAECENLARKELSVDGNAMGEK